MGDPYSGIAVHWQGMSGRPASSFSSAASGTCPSVTCSPSVKVWHETIRGLCCSESSPVSRLHLTFRRPAPIVNQMVQYQLRPHETFAALADPTRMAFLERLSREDATITQLADRAGISLPGARKHVKVLENVGLVTTRKLGRARVCTIGPRRMEQEAAWIAGYQRSLEERLDRLGDLLERLKEAP